MAKLSLEDLSISGKKVVMRVDFNVPLDADQNIVDPTRIEAALPSIQYLLDKGSALILMSHLGRPKNEPNPELSLKPVAKLLSALIDRPVQMASDCVGEEVEEMAQNLKPGEVLLLENLRFHRAETHPEEDPTFAASLARLGDVYVNDAFGTAHRKHSSTYTITQHFPGKSAAGYLLEKEIHYLGETLESPEHPFYALLGGAKISTKMGVIKALLKKVDKLLIGGGMAYTFLEAGGIPIGNSICEEELVPLAKELLEMAPDKILLPVDVLAGKECSEDTETKLVDLAQGIPSGFEGLDIGPKTVELFGKTLQHAKTLLWNGPVGVYEFDRFAQGTLTLAHLFGSLEATTLAGGGDLIAALKKAEVSDQVTHISTGGGATLEYVEFGTLPGIEALSEKSS